LSVLDRRAADLRDIVQEMLKQFQSVNAAAANGPHAELNIQELRVVEFLGDEGSHIMRELAAFLNVAVNSVTSIVDSLEKKGLVLRVRSEEDRRIIRVELTQAGRLIYQDALDVNMQLFRTMLRALSSEEQKIFLMLIRKIVRVGRTQVSKLATSASIPERS
jgi:DNA-binding MarR family transcriptional regulator